MFDHTGVGLLNRVTGPATVDAGEEPAEKGSRPALPFAVTTSMQLPFCVASAAIARSQKSGPAVGPCRRIFVALCNHGRRHPGPGRQGGVWAVE